MHRSTDRRAANLAGWRPALGLALLALASACSEGGVVSATNESPALMATSGQASLLELLAAGPELVPHEGIRLVEIFDVDGSGNVTPLSYRERIAIDGMGAFSLSTESVETSVLPDEATFLLLQSARSGYLFRYRDFRIHSLDQLVQNYHLVAVAAQPQTIAGREAELLSFAHAGGQGPDYEVWVDRTTGLALSIEVFDGNGALMQRTAYESYVDGPPAVFVADVNSNQEFVADLSQPLEPQLGLKPALAAEVPDGFGLHEVASVVDPTGAVWSKATYTDGIETIFLLGRLASLVSTDAGPAFVEAAASTPQDDDRLYGYQAGRAMVLDGQYGDRSRIAVGNLPAYDLQGFLESSL